MIGLSHLSSSAARPNGLTLVESNPDRIVLELDTPDYRIETFINDKVAFQKLTATGLGETGERGAPGLPLSVAAVAIPPGADYRLEITAETRPLPNRVNIAPVPTLTSSGKLTDTFNLPGEYIYGPSDSIYQRDEYYPHDFVRIGDDEFLRSQRVLRLELLPFQ
ncbi:MAG TPA: C25 family peptidase propeptide domain-containing protein, partial [Anaerolineae bacterium]